MLSQYPKEKIKRKIIVLQRKVILAQFAFILVLSLILFVNNKASIDAKNKAQNIITSAQEEANRIILAAEEEANITIFNSEVDAKAIKFNAYENARLMEASANNLIENAESEAKDITYEAEKKADIIIDDAINIKIDDVQVLMAITEAEAGTQSIKGKAAVAATIKNRLESSEFQEDTIKEIVYSPGQFDPVENGKIEGVVPTPSTIEAVKLCLEGVDYSNGALYFYNPEESGNNSKLWFCKLETTTIIEDHIFKK